MPILEQDPDRIDVLKSHGLDPREYYIDENFDVKPREAAPAQPAKGGALSAGVKSAIYNIPEMLGGAAGYGVGAMLAPETMGLSMLLPLAGTIGGSYLAGKGKQAILPESFLKAQAAREEEHPVASTVGELASNLAVANPVKSVKNIADVVRELPTLTKGLSPRSMGILANAGGGAALGGGISVGRDLYEGKDIDVKEAGMSALANALFHEPNAVGRLASFGQMHATPELAKRSAGLKESMTSPAAEIKPQMDSTILQAFDDSGLAERFGAQTMEEKLAVMTKLKENASLPEKKRAGMAKKLQGEIDLLNKSVDLEPDVAKQTATRERVTGMERDRDLLTGAETFYKAVGRARAQQHGLEEQAARDQQPAYDDSITSHGPGEAPKNVEEVAALEKPADEPDGPGTSKFAARQADEAGAKELALIKSNQLENREAAIEGQRVKEAYDLQGIEREKAMRRDDAAKAAAKRVNVTGLADAMTGNTIARTPDVSSPLFTPPDRLSTETKTIAPEAKPQSDVDQARLEGVRERYQPGNDTAGSGNSTEAWDQMMAHAYGKPLGAKVKVGANLPENVRGKATLRSDPTAQALIELGKTAGFDTSPHELIHVLLDDMKSRGGRGQARAEAFEKAAGGEEHGVQAAGEHFVKRVMGDDSMWKDLGALVKHWMGSATKEDYARLMSNTLERGNLGGERGGSGGVRYQTSQQDTPEFQKWFGGSKVVDEQGKPLTVYHGTSKDVDFNAFRGNKNGIWFTSSPEGASKYAAENDSMGYSHGPGWKVEPTNTASRVIPAQLSLQNPKSFEVWPDSIRHATNYKKALGDFFTELKAQGHDGAIFGSGNDKTYVAFDPTQVKSAIGNRGTFDPAKNDIRYQTATSELGTLGMDAAGSPEKTKFNIFSSVTDRLLNSGDPGKAYLGRKFNELFRAKDEMAAKYRTGINPLYDAKPEQIDTVYRILLGEERSGQLRRAVVRPDLLPLYDSMRGTYAKMREDQIAAGGKNRDGSKLGQDPTGFPNIIDPRVSEKISGGTRDAVYQKLKKDFIDYNKSRGVKNPEEEFNKYVGTLTNKSDPFGFKATDTRENTKLPDSWIEPDGLKAYNKYIDRWAKARTWEEGMLKDPKAAEALGLNKGTKGPDSTVVLDPNVQAAMDFYGGMNTSADHKFINSVGRLVNSLLLGGPSTRITDALTTPIKGLSYISPSAVPAYLHAMTNIRGAYERSLATGLNKRGGRQVFEQIIGAGADATGKLDAASQFITKWTGSEATETAARTLAQVAGEFIAKHQSALAAAGDQSAVKFLEHLGITPGMDPAIAGTRAAQLLQGKYDITNLPAWAFNSPAAPFVGMMKWNIEQWNNFKRFAVEPMVKDKNLTPALMTIAAGLTGGVGLAVFRQALSGRKDYHATFDEIANAPDKVRAMEELASKLAYAAQLTGTLGVMGELGSQMIDVGTGKIPNGVHYPAASVLADTFSKTASAMKGIGDGEDPMKVIVALVNDVARSNVQAYRVAANLAAQVADTKELQTHNMQRDKTVFDNLSGQPRRLNLGNTPSYSNLSGKEFAREQDVSRLGPEAMALTQKALAQGGNDPTEIRKRLNAVKPAAPRYMPNPNESPIKFQQFLHFVTQTQGPAAAQQVLHQYLTDSAMAQAKRGLIP